MSVNLDSHKFFEIYLKHVVSEAREASKRLLGSFLIEKRKEKKYIRTHILFVSKTEKLDVEAEIETWFKIYKWIEDKKDELLHKYGLEKEIMIVLYPRFVNFEEFQSLSEDIRQRLEKIKIIWHEPA